MGFWVQGLGKESAEIRSRRENSVFDSSESPAAHLHCIHKWGGGGAGDRHEVYRGCFEGRFQTARNSGQGIPAVHKEVESFCVNRARWCSGCSYLASPSTSLLFFLRVILLGRPLPFLTSLKSRSQDCPTVGNSMTWRIIFSKSGLQMFKHEQTIEDTTMCTSVFFGFGQMCVWSSCQQKISKIVDFIRLMDFNMLIYSIRF